MSIWSWILSQPPPFPPKATAFKMKILILSPPSKSLSCLNLLSHSKLVLLCAVCYGRRYLLDVCLYVLKKNLVYVSSSPHCGSEAKTVPFLGEKRTNPFLLRPNAFPLVLLSLSPYIFIAYASGEDLPPPGNTELKG